MKKRTGRLRKLTVKHVYALLVEFEEEKCTNINTGSETHSVG